MKEKSKVRFVCQNCGHISFKWLGRCPECGEWGTFQEENIRKETYFRGLSSGLAAPKPLTEIDESEQMRYSSEIKEFDRILGGGIVPGSLILIGGEPGIGKSTLLLEIGDKLSSSGHLVLYVSGEESAEQIRGRASRLGINSRHLYVLSETNLERIAQQIDDLGPEMVIIDSIQTLYREDYESAPGSVSQVRECAAYLMRLAKQRRITIFLIGHVTKEGTIAGPRVLEHIVDTVLYFESERNYQYRILRAVKNRFGPISEIGIFKMEESGLKEVEDPSKLFLSDALGNPGIMVVSTIEGTRSFLVEIQALATTSNLTIPRRISQGVDYNRLCLLLAVLERRCGLRLYDQDVYLNVAGGMKVKEPACDLAIALSVASSLQNIPLPGDSLAIGEVGLSGEVRPVGFMEKRLKEAARLGFTRCFVSRSTLKKIKAPPGMRLIGVREVKEALDIGLEGR